MKLFNVEGDEFFQEMYRDINRYAIAEDHRDITPLIYDITEGSFIVVKESGTCGMIHQNAIARNAMLILIRRINELEKELERAEARK